MDEIIGSGVLPIAIKDKEIYILLGRENNNGRSNNSWCGFGGGRDSGEKVIETAIREFMEETMAIIMSKQEIENIIKYNKNNRLIARYLLRDVNVKPYVEHVVLIDYDEKLPNLFDRVYKQFGTCSKLINRSCSDSNNSEIYGQCNIIGTDIGKTCLPLFEKDKIGWFKLDEIVKIAEHQYMINQNKLPIIIRPCFIKMILVGHKLIRQSINHKLTIDNQ